MLSFSKTTVFTMNYGLCGRGSFWDRGAGKNCSCTELIGPTWHQAKRSRARQGQSTPNRAQVGRAEPSQAEPDQSRADPGRAETAPDGPRTTFFNGFFAGPGGVEIYCFSFPTIIGQLSLHHRMVSNPTFSTPSSRTQASIFDTYIFQQRLKNQNGKHVSKKNAIVSVSQIESINFPKTGQDTQYFW